VLYKVLDVSGLIEFHRNRELPLTAKQAGQLPSINLTEHHQSPLSLEYLNTSNRTKQKEITQSINSIQSNP